MSLIFGVLTNTSMVLHTLLFGTRVGEDAAGNVYYKGKPRRGQQRERRWVMYKGRPDPTTVPAQWYGWLHHQTDLLPEEAKAYVKTWQKPHKPNMTGTAGAYLPPGHTVKGGKRAPATGDYTPWMPAQAERKKK